MLLLAAPPIGTVDVFTTVHIAATAVTTGILALICAFALLGRQQGRLLESVVIGALSGAAVLLWRKSANMPQLNKDGLNGFSANDWLAPTITFVVLGVYRNLRVLPNEHRFGRALAVATIIALIVNVVTI